MKSVFVLLLFHSTISFAQNIEVQPAEIVEAPPVDKFSDRSGVWKSESHRAENIKLESRPALEALNDIPGVQARFEGSPTISIRGSQAYSRVLGLYNGIPLNSEDGFGAEALLIPNENIFEVKLFKGPASLFYGVHAMGGAINFLPELSEGPKIRGEVGSNSQRALFGSLPIYKKGKHDFAQITAYNNSVDQRSPLSPSNHHLQRYTAWAEQTFENWRFTENILYGAENRVTTGPTSSPLTNYQNRNAALASFGIDWLKNDYSEWNYRLFGVQKNSQNQSSFGPSNFGANKIGNNLSYKHSFKNKSQVSVLMDHSYDEYIASTLAGKIISNSFESALIYDFPIDEVWIARVGSRYLFTESILVPALGLFKENEKQKLWITYAEGYHRPSLSHKFEVSPFFQGNPDLKPELAKQFEVGFLEGKELTYGLTIFLTDYQDLMAYTGSPVGTYKNINAAQSSGVEGQFGFEGNVWGVMGALTYLDAKEKVSREPLPLSPKFQATTLLNYMWGPLVFELRDNYWSEYFDKNAGVNVQLGPWNTVDFSVKTLGLSDWEFKASVFNLFDAQRQLSIGFPEPGRKFWVAVERGF